MNPETGHPAARPEPAPSATRDTIGTPVAGPSHWRVLLSRARRRALGLSRSLLVRTIVATFVLTSLAVLLLGFIIQQQITNGLLQSKIDAAVSEIGSARTTVENSLAGADSDPSSLSEQLRVALTEVGRDERGTSGAGGAVAGVFEPVILPSRVGADTDLDLDQPLADVPAELRARVSQGNVSYQYTTIRRDGASVPALVVGSPARTNTDSFEVYLIFPLGGELGTVQVVQRTLALGGAGLAVTVTLIAGLVAHQVVRPVRRAAETAGKLAAGDLGERMPVSGPAELTTLARSFNGMADAIRAQIRQLEEFGALQRRFTSDVSHELRTPLTTVRMAADILHGGREDFPAPLARSTELMVDELDRFEALLAELLEISRHDSGMAELSAEPIDVRSRISAAVAAAQPLAEQSGVELRMTLPDEPVVAEIDTRRVDRIVRNLVNNAIDHAEGHPVQIELAADEDVLAVAVTDEGIGLRPGEAGLVFNRFWRADPSRQRHTGGTGLGLAISLEDARLHGGWLQASGSPGRGARFRLTLPRRRGGLIAGSPLPLWADAEQDQGDDLDRTAGGSDTERDAADVLAAVAAAGRAAGSESRVVRAESFDPTTEGQRRFGLAADPTLPTVRTAMAVPVDPTGLSFEWGTGTRIPLSAAAGDQPPHARPSRARFSDGGQTGDPDGEAPAGAAGGSDDDRRAGADGESADGRSTDPAGRS